MMYQVQSVHTVFTSATLSCLGSLLFSQGQQCSVLATCALRSIAPLRPSTYMPFARVPAHCLPCPLLTLPTAYTGLTGRPHSPRAIADTATAIAGLTCSFPALLARLAFLPMRDPRTKRRYQELLRERELLFLLSGVANPRNLLTPRRGTGRRGGSTEASAWASDALSSVSFPEAPAPQRASFGPSRRPKLSLHQVMSSGTEVSGSELSGTELSISEESAAVALEAPGVRAPEAEVHSA